MIIEVDARYIKGMLANPDLNPGASINRWILSILTFHFVLIHVPGTMHGLTVCPDADRNRATNQNQMTTSMIGSITYTDSCT